MQALVVLFVSGFIAAALAANGRIATLPICTCDGITCECCGGFSFKTESKSACIRTNFIPNEATMTVELLLDGQVITSRTLSPDAVAFCAPVPPFRVCVRPRKVDINRDNPKVCLGLDVKVRQKTVYKQNRLPCITLKDGKLGLTRN